MGEDVAVGTCASAEELNPPRASNATANAAIKQLRVNVVGDSMPAPFSLFHFITGHCMTIPPSGCRIDPV